MTTTKISCNKLSKVSSSISQDAIHTFQVSNTFWEETELLQAGQSKSVWCKLDFDLSVQDVVPMELDLSVCQDPVILSHTAPSFTTFGYNR